MKGRMVDVGSLPTRVREELIREAERAIEAAAPDLALHNESRRQRSRGQAEATENPAGGGGLFPTSVTSGRGRSE